MGRGGAIKKTAGGVRDIAPNNDSSRRLSFDEIGEGIVRASPVGTKLVIYLALSEIPIIISGQQPLIEKGHISGVIVVVSYIPSSSPVGRASSSAIERGKFMVIGDYKSESDLDPDDFKMFELGLTHSVVPVGGSLIFLRSLWMSIS